MPLLFFFVRIQDPLIRKRMWMPLKRAAMFGQLSVKDNSSEANTDEIYSLKENMVPEDDDSIMDIKPVV